MADRDRFLSQCDQCKEGTVGWLISQLVEKASVEWGQGLQFIATDLDIHFETASHQNLNIISVYTGEDGSVCINLEQAK